MVASLDTTSAERSAFGAALGAARRAAGLTQTELADRVGRKQQTIGNYEAGEKAPTPKVAVAIEEVCGVAPGELTKHLGYLPLSAAGQVIEHSVIDAILADPDLTDGQRSSLLATYREFTRR